MTKLNFRKAILPATAFLLTLLVAVVFYPRIYASIDYAQWAVDYLPVFAIPGMANGTLYSMLLLVLFDAGIKLHRVRQGDAVAPAPRVFLRVEALCAVLCTVLFVPFALMALNMGSIHTLYWKVVPVIVCVWLLCLAMSVTGQFCTASPWGIMRYFYIGMLGCVSGLNVYWGRVEAVPIGVEIFLAGHMQPVYIAGMVVFVLWLPSAIKAKASQS